MAQNFPPPPPGAVPFGPEDTPAPQVMSGDIPQAPEGAVAIPEAPVQREPNFFERVGEKLENRVERVQRGTQAYEKGEITYPELVTYGIGFGVGALFDTVGEGVMTVLSQLTPDSAEEFLKEQIAAGGTKLMSTDTAQQAMEIYQSLEQHEKDRLANLTDIAFGMMPKGKVGKVIRDSGIQAEKKAISKYVLNNSYGANQRRAAEHGLAPNMKTATNFDEQVLNTVVSIPGVSASASRTKIMSALNKELAILGKKVKNALQTSEFPTYPKATVNTQLRKELRDFLEANPKYATKSMRGSVSKVMEAYRVALQKYDGKTQSLLKLRRDFDDAVETIFKKDVHAGDDASREIVAALRNRMNTMMEEAIPDETLRATMRRQHHIMVAKSNLSYNMAREPKWWETAARKVEQHPMLTLGAASGSGGMLGSLMSSEAAGVAGLAGAGLYGITRPGVRQVAGQALSTLPVTRGTLYGAVDNTQDIIEGP